MGYATQIKDAMDHRHLFRISIIVGALCSTTAFAQSNKAGQDSIQTKNLESVSVQATIRRIAPVTTVSTRLSTDVLQKSLGKSLAEVLEQVSGVSSIQTGASGAKPVIHGMYGQRILILNNGVRQAGQQWSESHSPELDLGGSASVEVVKGTEGVRYGAEAMGGAVIMEQAALPYGSGSVSGAFSSLYARQGHAYGARLKLEGAVPQSQYWAWRVQGAYTNSGDKSTAHYLLNNSGQREANIMASLGYRRGALSVHGIYSLYAEEQGIMRSAQMGDVVLLAERIALGRPDEDALTPFTRSISNPKEEVRHHTATVKVGYRLPSLGRLNYQLSYQKDDRREYRIRRTDSSVPEIALNLSAWQQQLAWTHSYSGRWHTELGAQLNYVNNYSTPGTGVASIIPNYVERTWATYLLQRYRNADARLTLEAGLRLDGQSNKASGYTMVGEPYGGERRFTNLTYSLGAQYKLGKGWSLQSNFGTAWRAPHVHELYAEGVEHGSGAYLKGDADLQSEGSYKWITSLSYSKGRVRLSVDGYLQWVHNYIYDSPKIKPDGRPELLTVLSGAYPVFAYQQTGAFFRGVDIDAEVRLPLGLSYGLRTAWIWANERKTNAYLPYIPSLRVDHSLGWQGWLGRRTAVHAMLGHRFVAKQRRFDPNKDLIAYSPEAYHLLNVELGLEYNLPNGHNFSASLSGENLLNLEYKEYTNRTRYFAHELGRNIRLVLSYAF